MGVVEELWRVWQKVAGGALALDAAKDAEQSGQVARRTLPLPAIASQPWGRLTQERLILKPTPANLRRFAETPVARRAINLIKDRIAAMDWRIRVRRGYVAAQVADLEGKVAALRRVLEEPNAADSFRSLIEQVIEDALVGGYGAIEMEPTADVEKPAELWAVDGASIRVNAKWDGSAEAARYAQVAPGQMEQSAIPLRDDQLIYIRMNPRSFTPFGLGPLEVAFESIDQFLSAHRFAGKLAANSVAQYALWLNGAAPTEQDRMIRWWQDEIEGTGRVPLIATTEKPEVLRFAQGTDADLRLEWQQFLIRMIANAFGLPPMLLGLESVVNRATAVELADEAFRGAISPLAKLIEGHITRDLFGKCIGWNEFEFVFNDLDARDELTELQVQVDLLGAGVLTVNEVRAMRGLEPLITSPAGELDQLA